ncbi:MAG: hypothetical protein H0V01_05835 [Bacteroidetes bacterium]|nr:hypothetical protein [Bacteroidota bacterium]HET6244331.1 hypothetical protein [Bacteroidia bacterium]
MKKLLVVILIAFSIVACETENIDQPKAEQAVETLINFIKLEEYENVSNLYTVSLNSGESLEDRTEKLKMLRNAMGILKSYELIEAEQTAEFAEQVKLNLTYKIKYARVTSIEKFSIIKEDGNYKIARHDIKTENFK